MKPKDRELLERLIREQEHEWKPRALIDKLELYNLTIKQIHYERDLMSKLGDSAHSEKSEEIKNPFLERPPDIKKDALYYVIDEDLEVISLLEKMLSDNMKDVWLWIKLQIYKRHKDLPDEQNDWYFGQYGNKVFYHVQKGLGVNKWHMSSKSDLNNYIEEVIKSLRLTIGRINNSPLDVHLLDILEEREREYFMWALNVDDDEEHYSFALPQLNINKILSLYISFIKNKLSEFEKNRTYTKPRSGNNDKYVIRDTFINSIYDLTIEDFGSPHHDFVALISRKVLDDDKIDTSIVRAIYNRRGKD